MRMTDNLEKSWGPTIMGHPTEQILGVGNQDTPQSLNMIKINN